MPKNLRFSTFSGNLKMELGQIRKYMIGTHLVKFSIRNNRNFIIFTYLC